MARRDDHPDNHESPGSGDDNPDSGDGRAVSLRNKDTPFRFVLPRPLPTQVNEMMATKGVAPRTLELTSACKIQNNQSHPIPGHNTFKTLDVCGAYLFILVDHSERHKLTDKKKREGN